MRYAIGFRPTAVPTARAAVGRSIASAIAPYEVAAPSGIWSSACHTWSWKFVPFRNNAIGLALPSASPNQTTREVGDTAIVSLVLRAGPIALETLERCPPVAVHHELEPAHTAVGRCNHAFAKRARRKAVPYDQVPAQFLVLTRRHRLDVDEEIVQPPRARQPGLVRRREDREPTPQRLLGVRDGEKLEKTLRAHPGPAPEEPLQMELAQPHRLRRVLERGLLAGMRLEILDDRLDAVIVPNGLRCGDHCLSRLEKPDARADALVVAHGILAGIHGEPLRLLAVTRCGTRQRMATRNLRYLQPYSPTGEPPHTTPHPSER